MFCQKCGAELKQGAAFCIKCGNKAPVLSRESEMVSGTEKDTLTKAVVMFQKGNTNAFDTIYNESKRYIYYTILKTTCDKEVADDILQETYLDVYKSLNQLQNPEAFKGWAAKIAQHKIGRYYQKKMPDLFSSEEEMDNSVGELTEGDMSALPEDAMINKEVQKLISGIIDELPQNQKCAVISYFYNQMSISEIAQSMGVPENTVKTYLFRGKNRIKDGVLEIEKKHGTKLYALPLAGLLGLLFSEEAKAAVVPTTSSQVLDSTAKAAGRMAVSSFLAGKPVSTSSSASISESAAMSMSENKDVFASETVSTISSSESSTYKIIRDGIHSTKKIGSRVIASSIIKVLVGMAVGFSVGIVSTSYVMNNSEVKETINSIPIISYMTEIGKPKYDFIGTWTDDTQEYFTINEDNTFFVIDQYNHSMTGTWVSDGENIHFNLNTTLWGEIFDSMTMEPDSIGFYDKDTDTLVVQYTHFGSEIYMTRLEN